MLLLLERWFDKPGKKTLHEVIWLNILAPTNKGTVL
jgi:hypothetical protein